MNDMTVAVADDGLRVRDAAGAVVLSLCAQPELVLEQGEHALPLSRTAGGVASWNAEDDAFRFERTVTEDSEHALRVRSRLTVRRETALVGFAERMRADVGPPRYVWTPNLCPDPDDVVGDHAFRAPAAVVHGERHGVALVPELHALSAQRRSDVGAEDWRYSGIGGPQPPQIKAYLNLLRLAEESRLLTCGFADYECRPHVYYRLTGKPVRLPAGHELVVEFTIFVAPLGDPYDIRRYLAHLWERYARPLTASIRPQVLSMAEYHAVSFRAALAMDDVPDFALPDGRAGAGVRNCSSRAARDIASSYFKIPPRVVWFSAWFNSFRTAFGMLAQARRGVEPADMLRRKAEGILELLLSAPDPSGKGLIPQIYAYDRAEWWCAVPRLAPAGRNCFDLTASCHTARWMLLWHRYLEADERLLHRAGRLADALLALQDADGAFPAYVDLEGRPLEPLRQSGQAGMVASFLCELYRHRPDAALLDAIERACGFFIEQLIPSSRYHDFEVFFSCSQKPLDFFDRRTGQHAQNTLNIAWIADTLLQALRFTGKPEYGRFLRHVLDHLSWHQQVWNPPFLKLYAFGGMAAQNTDGEWNDMRQVWFSTLYMDAFRETGLAEDFERGAAALRSACALLSHPAHRDTNPVHYDAFPAGLMPENYAHSGNEAHAHRSSFDWGAGALAAAAALNRFMFGDVYVDAYRGQAFGIDGIVARECRVEPQDVRVTVEDQTGTDRELTFVCVRNGERSEHAVRLAPATRETVRLPHASSNGRAPG